MHPRITTALVLGALAAALASAVSDPAAREAAAEVDAAVREARSDRCDAPRVVLTRGDLLGGEVEVGSPVDATRLRATLREQVGATSGELAVEACQEREGVGGEDLVEARVHPAADGG